MDFELLSEKPKPPNLVEEFERLIGKRRWHWQRWAQRPPHHLGFAVLFLVVVEFVISMRLVNGLAIDRSMWRHIAITGGTILLIESALALLTTQAADLFGATGKMGSLLTFFNLGLTPLLLLAPMSLISVMSSGLANVRLVALMLLLAKVMLNWREAIEHNYKFTRGQSALVIYAAAVLTMIALALAAYLSLARKLAGLF